MTFKATSGGTTITATVTAWYLNGTTLQSATLGQYSSGLGVCYKGVNCSGSTEELSNSANDEFLLFQFSAPVDPTTITLKSPVSSALGVSYWLGSTTTKPLNLSNMNMTTSLSTLGFGSQNSSNAGNGTTRTVDFGGAPSTSVNAVLFGGMFGYSNDYFDVTGMSGVPVSGGSGTLGASVPEPASIFLLFPVIVAGFSIRRRQQLLRSRAS